MEELYNELENWYDVKKYLEEYLQVAEEQIDILQEMIAREEDYKASIGDC